MKNSRLSRNVHNFKYQIVEGFKDNKKTCFIIFIVCLIGVLTGIFTAINYCNGVGEINFNDFSICQFLNGELGSLDLFFSRFLSYSVVIIIVSVCSFTVYLSPISFFVLTYRGYLLSLNVAIMVILYGISGIMTGLLIVLPCHLLSLIVIGIYICVSNKKALLKKKYGTCYFKTWDKFLVVLIVLTLINIVETLLLTVFSSRVILVI